MNEHSFMKKERVNRKALIVATALRLFATEGYDSTPISRIAKEAGIAQGLLYNYFRSKGELLQAIIKEGFDQIREEMQPYLNATDPAKALKEHIGLSLQLVERHRDFWKLVHSLRMQHATLRDAMQQVQEVNAFVLQTLTTHFRKLGYKKPELEAWLLFATVDGLVGLYLLAGDEFPLHRLGKHLVDRYANKNLK